MEFISGDDMKGLLGATAILGGAATIALWKLVEFILNHLHWR